jgi:hypothetical protein
MGGDNQDVDIANRLLPASITAGHLKLLDRRVALQVRQERLQVRIGVGQSPAARTTAKVGNSLENLARRRFFDAAQLSEPSVFRRLFQGVHRLDAERVVDQLGALWTEARDTEHRDEPLGCLCREFLKEGKRARFENCADFLREIAADARELVESSFTGQRSSRSGQRLDRARRRMVRTHAEGILALDLQEVGDLVEDAGDVDVFHGPPWARVRFAWGCASRRRVAHQMPL